MGIKKSNRKAECIINMKNKNKKKTKLQGLKEGPDVKMHL